MSVVTAAVAGGCGGSAPRPATAVGGTDQPPAVGTDAPPVAAEDTVARGRYRVTVISASIASRRPDGKPWHVQSSGGTLKLVAGVAGRMMGLPEIGAEAGRLMTAPDKDLAPRAYVDLNVAGKSYRTFAEDPTLAPAWNHELAVDLEGVPLDGQITLLVKDGIDDGVIGQATLTVRELLAQPGHTVTGTASVPIISLAVAPMGPARSEVVRVWVPADRTLDQLTANGAQGWQTVQVEAGDVVTIRAEGKSCVDRSGGCYGPEGHKRGLPVQGSFDRVAWFGAENSYDLFKTSPHAMLVAMVGGAPVRVGRETSFAPHRAGDIVLFINDKDVRNNSDGLKVEVLINHDGQGAPVEAPPPTGSSTPVPVSAPTRP